jgi:hypothetical protein
MVRVTLTNHRRLCLFPTDYEIRHAVVTVKVNPEIGVVSAPPRAVFEPVFSKTTAGKTKQALGKRHAVRRGL